MTGNDEEPDTARGDADAAGGSPDRSAPDDRADAASGAFERLVDDPPVHEPILLVQLDGWIDASESARGAADAVDLACDASPIIRFDDDTYIDYRARRPILELRDGVSTNLSWPTLELRAGRSPDGRDVLLLRGPEPDTAWRRFGRAIASLATEFRVTHMVGFGAYPFASPHTRPSRLSVSSPSVDVLGSVPFARSSVDVPAGAEALLEHALHAAKVPALGLWAQVPHYAATGAYSAASVALLDGLHTFTGVRISGDALRAEADEQIAVLDQKLEESPDLASLLASMEEAYDRTVEEERTSAAQDPELELRSGDELAAEIQQFLRDND